MHVPAADRPRGRLQLLRRRVIGEDDATGIRDNDDWVYRQTAGPEAICHLEQLAVDIPLASLYSKITFPEL